MVSFHVLAALVALLASDFAEALDTVNARAFPAMEVGLGATIADQV